MIRKQKSKDGTRFYVYVLGADGARKYVGAFGSSKEAKEAEDEHRVRQRKIRDGRLPADMDHKRTLKTAVDEWIAYLKANPGRKGHKSWDIYETRMKSSILPTFGGVAIESIESDAIRDWIDGQVGTMAAVTVNANLTCLSSAFTFFVDRKWAATNPCHKVKRLDPPKRRYVWIRTAEEITRLLMNCTGDIMDICAMASGSGLRLDEILHLQWADIDLESRLIDVHRGRKGTTKDGEGRSIPVLDSVLPMLRRRALARGGALLVFPGKTKPGAAHAPVRSKAGVYEAFKRAALAAALDRKLRFHDLRHTFASHWVARGGDIFKLSKMLGHSSVVITEEYYAHLAPDIWTQDYHRGPAFTVPAEAAVYEFERGADGRVTDRVLKRSGTTPVQKPIRAV